MDADAFQLATGVVVPRDVVADALTFLERHSEITGEDESLSFFSNPEESFRLRIDVLSPIEVYARYMMQQ